MPDDPDDPRAWPRDRMLAYLYDWEHDAFQDDLAFYTEVARRSGGPALELACGSGRVLAALARGGIDVVGVDSSPAMLARARSHLSSVPTSVQLLERDLREPLPEGPFPLVVLALDALGLVTEPGGPLDLMRRVKSVLVDGGVVVIDLLHFGALADQAQGVAVLQDSRDDPFLQAHVAKWMVRRLLPATQVLELHLFYDVTWNDGSLTRLTDLVSLRYFSRFEIELLLEAAGLEVVDVHGDYDLGPFCDESERVVILATPHAAPGLLD